MKPMQLPDLVLGVRIEADVTGTRQAITKLQRSINQQTGYIAGSSSGGMGGGLLGGATGAGLTALLMGGKGKGTQTKGIFGGGLGFKVGALATALKATSPSELYKQKRMIMAGDLAILRVQRNQLKKMLQTEKITKDDYDVRKRGLQHQLYALKAESKAIHAKRLSHGKGGMVGIQGERAIAGQFQNLLAGAGAGGLLQGGMGRGGLMQKGLKLAGLGKLGKLAGVARFGIIGAILAALLASIWAFVKSLKAAVAYIRQSIVNDKVFRPFVNQLDRFGQMWTNLWRQTGLMLITVLPLTEALAAFTNVLKIWGTIIAGITPFLKTMASLNFNFTVLRFIANLYSKIPGGSGGISLPMGPKMAPGALEGSVEAYRSIYGGADYLAKIADNTFDMKQTLRKFVQGFVVGVIGG